MDRRDLARFSVSWPKNQAQFFFGTIFFFLHISTGFSILVVLNMNYIV